MNYEFWIRHFTKNKLNRTEPNWKAPQSVTGRQRRLLVRSLQQFQLGDGGGPAYLIAHDRNQVLHNDARIKTLVDLWFKEEAEHSRLLGAALERFQAPSISTHWSFELFCNLRKHLGVQFELDALLLTEIVSHVYYKMLYHHCPDEAVRGMCRLIIRDETGHIAFHLARLNSMAASGERRLGPLWAAGFRLRGIAAGSVLWVNHRAALISMGATDREFYHRIWKDMGKFIQRIQRRAEAPSTEETSSTNEGAQPRANWAMARS